MTSCVYFSSNSFTTLLRKIEDVIDRRKDICTSAWKTKFLKCGCSGSLIFSFGECFLLLKKDAIKRTCFEVDNQTCVLCDLHQPIYPCTDDKMLYVIVFYLKDRIKLQTVSPPMPLEAL